MGKVVRDICPAAPGAQGLAAVGLLAAHRPALHPAQQPVHGLRERGGELHRRHALRRRERQDVRRARAATAASSPPGTRSTRRKAWSIKEQLPGLERRARRRPATSSSTGRWKAGSRRWTRSTGNAAVAVQDRLRDHRPADHLPRPGRQAVRRDPLGRRRLGRRDRLGRPRSRATAPRRSASSTR